MDAMNDTAVAVEELESLRAPLTRYCYRLLGSAADTDDAVQETLIRAVRNADRYDPARARLTTWVHRIATNICIDILRGAQRRALAVDLGPASEGGDLGALLPPERFVEPMPDRRLFGAADPGEVAVERETVRLAFIALLQKLTPRQRAALVLRDILSFSARETAEILDTTVAAVNSSLQRARVALETDRPEPADVFDPADADQRELLRRYVAAFESHDVAGLTALLREDAAKSMPPFAWWIRGGARIAALSHEVIHGLDITEPLRLPAPPAERIGLVLGAAGPRNLAYFGADLAGRRLVATDADAALGDGTELRLPAKELLLIVTGRKALADATEGM